MAIFKRIAVVTLRISISLALLIFLFTKVDFQALVSIFRLADKPLIVLAFAVTFLGNILAFMRWKMLLDAQGVQLPLSRLIRPFAGGILFSLFLPSTIGGDIVRSIDLAAQTKKTHAAVASVFLDRLSGFIGLVIVALLALFFGSRLIDDPFVISILIGMVAILLFVLTVIFRPAVYAVFARALHGLRLRRLAGAVEGVHKEMLYFGEVKSVIWKNIVLSVFIQLVAPVTTYFLSLAFGLHVSIVYFLVFVPIIGAITMLPVSIGGLGLRDAGAVFFFPRVGISKDLAFGMSLTGFFFIVVMAALGGIIYVFTLHHRRV